MEKWVDGDVAETYGYNPADEIQFRNITGGSHEVYAYAYRDDDALLMDFQKWLSPQLKPRETQSFDYREKMTAFRRAFTVMLGDQVVAQESLTVDYAYLPDGMGRVGKKSAFYSRWEGGPVVPERTIVRNTQTFVLNDFYNLLDEEITTIESINGGPPAIDTVQKVYTMGPGIDFPLAMRHNADSYLYYLNGHGDVSSFVSMDGSYEEPYEYDAWGQSVQPNGINILLFKSMSYDSEGSFYAGRNKYYMPHFAYYTYPRAAEIGISYNDSLLLTGTYTILPVYFYGSFISSYLPGDGGAFPCCSGPGGPGGDPASRCARCAACCERLLGKQNWACLTVYCVDKGCCQT